jgi:hypothetical protein
VPDRSPPTFVSAGESATAYITASSVGDLLTMDWEGPGLPNFRIDNATTRCMAHLDLGRPDLLRVYGTASVPLPLQATSRWTAAGALSASHKLIIWDMRGT